MTDTHVGKNQIENSYFGFGKGGGGVYCSPHAYFCRGSADSIGAVELTTFQKYRTHLVDVTVGTHPRFGLDPRYLLGRVSDSAGVGGENNEKSALYHQVLLKIG